MGMINTYSTFVYGFFAIAILILSFRASPGAKRSSYYIVAIAGFLIGGLIVQSYLVSVSAVIALFVTIYRLRQHIEKNRPIEVILITDRDDNFLNYFINYYRKDITKYFPRFNFKIEDEFLVALIFSNMETIGLIIAEIRDEETLRICIDYMVPKHRNSQLARTFYLCELRCIDFLGFRQIYIEPQSKEHNNYLERIGFKLVDGKYVNGSHRK
jgi:hypothetical protein